MSKNYEFLAMLDLKYSKENSLLILENGTRMGCIFKNQRFTNPEVAIIDKFSAMELVWSRHLENYEYGPLVYAKYYKTHFAIWFYNKNNKIYLYLSPTHIGWKKRYDLCDWYGIHFYRYQSFMLRLIGNNKITHFETYEYFNASYDAEDMSYNTKIYVKLYTYWAYDVHHHLKVNGKILGIIWLDAKMQPMSIKTEDNSIENILYDENRQQCWFAIHHNILLKFSMPADRTFIIEPMSNGSSAINQAELLDSGLRTIIELFKNMPVFRLITFKSDEDLININKMDDR